MRGHVHDCYILFIMEEMTGSWRVDGHLAVNQEPPYT